MFQEIGKKDTGDCVCEAAAQVSNYLDQSAISKLPAVSDWTESFREGCPLLFCLLLLRKALSKDVCFCSVESNFCLLRNGRVQKGEVDLCNNVKLNL